MSSADISELKSTVKRLEKVLDALESWNEKRTWEDARKLEGHIPIRAFSLEDRKANALFIRKEVLVEQPRKRTFADLVAEYREAEDLFLDFLRRMGDRDVREQRNKLTQKLIDDSKYYGNDKYGEESKSETKRRLRAVSKPTPEGLIKRILLRPKDGKFTVILDANLFKFERLLANRVRYTYLIRHEEYVDAIVEIVRNLVRHKKVDLTLDDVGIQERPPKSDTERVVTSRPIINTEVYNPIKRLLEEEVTERRFQIEELETSTAGQNLPATILPFEIFPAGEWETSNLIIRFEQRGIKLSGEQKYRIETITQTFRPHKIAVGKLDSRAYKGYWVFIFDNQNRVIAENPLSGHATYVIKGEWEEILNVLRLSKSEVRRHPNAKFVIHRDRFQWLADLKRKFRFWN